MDAEDFAGYDGGYGEAVEDVDEGFPDFYGGAAFTFVVEAVDYLSALYFTGRGRGEPLVTFAHSWFPRRRKKFSGQRIFKANNKHTVSKLWRPTNGSVLERVSGEGYLCLRSLLGIGSFLLVAIRTFRIIV